MRHDLVRKNTFLSAPVARLLHSGSSLTKYFSCCCSCQSISNSVRQYQSGDGKHTKTNNTNRLEHIKYLLNISPHWTLQSHVLRLLGKEGLERRDTKPIALKESIFTLLHRLCSILIFTHTHLWSSCQKRFQVNHDISFTSEKVQHLKQHKIFQSQLRRNLAKKFADCRKERCHQGKWAHKPRRQKGISSSGTKTFNMQSKSIPSELRETLLHTSTSSAWKIP